MRSVMVLQIHSQSSRLSSTRRSEDSLPWNGRVFTAVSGPLTIRKSHSYFLWLTMISSLSNNQKKQFAIIRIMDQSLDMELIFLLMTSQIQTTVGLASVTVITTKNTRRMTRHLGRDLTVVQQVLNISRQWSGRCGPCSLHEYQEWIN